MGRNFINLLSTLQVVRSLKCKFSLTLSLPRVLLRKKSWISFCKIVKCKQYHMKILLNSFHLNGHTLGFYLQLRRRPQRERHKIIGLISSTNALHVRFTVWYISLPSSAEQKRQMTKLTVLWKNTRRWIFLSLSGLELRPYEFSSWTVRRPHWTNWTCWNNHAGIYRDVNSIFKWRFPVDIVRGN